MTMLTDRDDGRTLAARVGDVLELRLTENATAGYSWTVDHVDTAVLEGGGTGSNYPTDRLGSAGEALFRFTVRGAGTGRLALRYGRPWEGAQAAIRRFAVTVTASR